MCRLYRHLDGLPQDLLGGALSIGNFDGVHQGHGRILSRLLEKSQQTPGPAVVLTFDPHPARLLRPMQSHWPLTWTERKAQLLGDAGVEAVIVYPTDEALLSMPPSEFFERIVLDKLQAKAMVEGPNFFFGHNREGNVALLDEMCRVSGIALEIVKPAEVDGIVVSSSRIRDSISQGHVELAARLLGRSYRIRGVVEHGQGRGNSLGYPTANVGKIDLLLPGEGIYAGRAWIDAMPYVTAMSVGGNPTFGESAMKVEAFLLDYDGDLYDRPIEIDFLARLRDIIKFETVEQLVAQIARDVAQTRQIAGKEEFRS